MRTVTKTVFSYDELSDSAKEKARSWYRSASEGDEFFAECVIEDAAAIAAIMGIDLRQTRKTRLDGKPIYTPLIHYSGFYSQGDGASFEGYYTYKKGALKALKAHAPRDTELHRICKALQDAQKKVFYSATCEVVTSGYYSHSGTMRFDFDMREGTGQASFNEAEEVISGTLKDFADWIYRMLEIEYDFQNSKETIEENIAANEYEFNMDGSIA